jgi:hypothetical protein
MKIFGKNQRWRKFLCAAFVDVESKSSKKRVYHFAPAAIMHDSTTTMGKNRRISLQFYFSLHLSLSLSLSRSLSLSISLSLSLSLSLYHIINIKNTH